MSVLIGHASIDENGNAKGGAAGDQTGKEVCTRSWYDKSWDKLIRPKNSAIAEKIAKAMEQSIIKTMKGVKRMAAILCLAIGVFLGYALAIKTRG